MGKTDILTIVNGFSVIDRLELVEEILKKIRQEETIDTAYSGAGLLEFAGILKEEEAAAMKRATAETREIDHDGW